MRICAVIMASGFARRAGFNKLLHIIDGKPMARHIMDTIQTVPFDRVVVVTRFPEIKAWAEELGYTAAWNGEAGEGQASSIRIGVAEAPGFDGYMFFTADQPHLSAAAIRALLQEFERHGDSIIIPLFDGQRGSPVIFPARLEKELLALQGDMGGRPIIAKDDKLVLLEVGDRRQGTDYDEFKTE